MLCVLRYILQKILIIAIEIFSEETLGHPHLLDTLSLFGLVFEHSQYEKFKLLLLKFSHHKPYAMHTFSVLSLLSFVFHYA